MINSRNVEDLDPPARVSCAQHIRLAKAAGVELVVTSTYRDYLAQDALYAIGRTVELNRRPVTNAKAGESWHNFKCAWDVVPIIGGKCVWDGSDPVWTEVIAWGKQAGAEAGAEWVTFPDRPHFQVRPSSLLTIHAARERFEALGTLWI